MQISARELNAILNGKIRGNAEARATRFSKIEEADTSSLCFIMNPKYFVYAQDTRAAIVIVPDDLNVDPPENTAFIHVENPYSAYAKLLEKYLEKKINKTGIEQPSFIADTAVLEENVYIGAFCYIGENVRIGKHSKIFPNTYIGADTIIGDNVIIYPGVSIYEGTTVGDDSILHSGVVIGSHGFGFAPTEKGVYEKVPQVGSVTIGKSVEIGSNTVIDRATLGYTHIQDGVKIDNLVQIAHNVEIGSHTVIAAQAGISGSTKVGKQVMIGGQAGLVGHIRIADGAKINAQSGVSKSIQAEQAAVTGSPAEAFRQHYKHLALMRTLPELWKRIEELEKRLEILS